MRAARESRRNQRSRQEIAVMDRQPDVVAVTNVEIGMRRHESLRLGDGRLAKAIDVMVAVTLGMGDPDQGTKCKVLLHRKTGLTGEVLAGDEEFFTARAPLRRARRVHD